MRIAYTYRIDTPEALTRAEEKQADCYERFNSVKVTPWGNDSIQIICSDEK